MKKFSILLTSLLFVQLSMAQEKPDKNYLELQSKFNVLIEKVDSLEHLVESNTIDLAKKSEYFSNVNTYFTVIAIILTVLTVLISVIIIFNESRAKNQIKDLRKRVYSYVTKINRELIDTAINQLISSSEKERYQAALILTYNYSFPYSDVDFKKIIEAFRNTRENQTQQILLNFLSSRESLYTETFFRELINSCEFPKNIYQILRYVFTSSSDFTSDLIVNINKQTNPFDTFKLVISNSMSISLNLSKKLLDSEKLINAIDFPLHLKTLQSSFDGIKYSITNQAGEDIFSKTLFALKLEEHLLKATELEAEKEKIEAVKPLVEKKNKEETVNKIIKKHGLVRKGDLIIDKDGVEIKTVDVVPTMIGIMETKKAVKIDGEVIFIEKIK